MLVPWKRGDTEPLRLTLTRKGRPQDLTNATAVFNMRPVIEDVGTTIERGAVTVVAVTKGEVEYHWQAGETDGCGAHRAEVEVTWLDGTTKTFPDNGHIDLVIDDDLG